MHLHNQRILLRRVIVLRIRQPALHIEAFVLPFDGFGLDRRLDAVVEVRHLQRMTGRADEDLRRLREAVLGIGDDAVAG